MPSQNEEWAKMYKKSEYNYQSKLKKSIAHTAKKPSLLLFLRNHEKEMPENIIYSSESLQPSNALRKFASDIAK